MHYKHIKFCIKKIETIPKKSVRQITVPRTLKVIELLKKHGRKDSAFVRDLQKE